MLESYSSTSFQEPLTTFGIHPNGLIDAGAEAEAAYIRFGGSPQKNSVGSKRDHVNRTILQFRPEMQIGNAQVIKKFSIDERTLPKLLP